MEKLNLVIAFLTMLLFVHLSDSCCVPKQFEGFQGVLISSVISFMIVEEFEGFQEVVAVAFKNGLYARVCFTY